MSRSFWIIIIILLVLGLIYFLFNDSSKPNIMAEKFNTNIKEVAKINDYHCSPKCCGAQWPIFFDGLDEADIKRTISDMANQNSPWFRTNYTCNGPNGAGCPCIPVIKNVLIESLNQLKH